MIWFFSWHHLTHFRFCAKDTSSKNIITSPTHKECQTSYTMAVYFYGTFESVVVWCESVKYTTKIANDPTSFKLIELVHLLPLFISHWTGMCTRFGKPNKYSETLTRAFFNIISSNGSVWAAVFKDKCIAQESQRARASSCLSISMKGCAQE